MALSYFDSVLIRNPRSVPAFYYRAVCFFNIRQYADALSDLTMANGIDPKISKTDLFFKVDSAIKSTNRNIDSLTHLISINPHRIPLLQKRSELYLFIGDSVSSNDDRKQYELLRQERSKH